MTLKIAPLPLALLATLLVAACSTAPGSAFDNFNSPASHEGPGCYDHKGRIDRTITTAAECKSLDWVWKPA